MHVVVIGAGVIGVTTAYYLSRLGSHVTVVDQNPDVACGASYANAGQLSYSYTDALARPELVSKLPALLAGRDAGYRIRLTADLIPWGLRFLSQCTNQRAAENTVAVLQIALRSEALMRELREQLPFDFRYQPAGKLVLLNSEKELDAARATVALKQAHGCQTEVLDTAATAKTEPAIAAFTDDFVGAVYSKRDSVADSRSFTIGLKDLLEKTGLVDFRLGLRVLSVPRDGRKVRSVELETGRLAADAIIVCAGAGSSALLRPLGVNPLVYPVRGYSVTLPSGDASPAVSITVPYRKLVFSRMDSRIRIAGYADFTGFRADRDAQRTTTLLTSAREIAPLAADYDSSERSQWGGFRPMRPDGQPLVGPSGMDGLYLNTGHGMLGWTLACASGYEIARDVTGIRD